MAGDGCPALRSACTLRGRSACSSRPLVDVPTVIGWLRPVVLVPASALAGMTPQQLEAILAHELAHIRRHDYLVNLLQTLVETLLFYHPAVWWLSRRIRIERENCCDDLAVSLCGDPVTPMPARWPISRSCVDSGCPGKGRAIRACGQWRIASAAGSSSSWRADTRGARPRMAGGLGGGSADRWYRSGS